MKVCPIQKYGMPVVMNHYVETGEVLGKGTDNLEGYTLRDRGYFGPGKLPIFNHEFFEIPNCRPDEWVFKSFKERLEREGLPSEEEVTDFANNVKEALDKNNTHIWNTLLDS